MRSILIVALMAGCVEGGETVGTAASVEVVEVDVCNAPEGGIDFTPYVGSVYVIEGCTYYDDVGYQCAPADYQITIDDDGTWLRVWGVCGGDNDTARLRYLAVE